MKMKRHMPVVPAAWSVALLALAIGGALGPTARADEGGSGHYLSGTTADFLDMVPDEPGFAYGNFPVYYHGSIGRSRQIELGGVVAANAKVTIWGDTSLLLYRTPWQIF